MNDAVTLRNCTELDEYRACVALQKEVWGFADNELVPVRIFSLAPKIGGQVIGAWDSGTLVGFAFSIPGTRNGRSYLHSHMLGVKSDYRNTGLGRRIKLFQRQDAIAQGYQLMEWTFDPLEIKNSYFNLERLGAIARRYNINQYGITSSPLQGFLPTDRLVAEWWLDFKARADAARNRKEPSIRSGIPNRSAGRDLCLEGWSRHAPESQRHAATESRAIPSGVLSRPRMSGLRTR